MYDQHLAPIILFVYNRPEHTKRTVEALLKNELASESVLYVFADGVKRNASVEQKNKIRLVRDYIHDISGFKKVFIEEAEQNRGLANSVISGVTKVIDEYGRVIVLEDDIITHPFFLRFMNDCLNVYSSRNDVFMIGGFSLNIKFPWWYRKDIYATYRSCSWGWATWKDRWICADWNVSDYVSFSNDLQRISKFNRGGDDMYPMLNAQMNGKIDSWAIRWDYCMSSYNAICIRPVKTLCTNYGMDGSGVHCGFEEKRMNNEMYKKDIYLFSLEKTITPSKIISRRFKNFFVEKQSFWKKIHIHLRHYIHISRVLVFKKIGLIR